MKHLLILSGKRSLIKETISLFLPPAGSGKTTVLVRRVIEKLKAGSQIDELLIVTFTEAAAREMKERIQVALQMAINQESQEQKDNISFGSCNYYLPQIFQHYMPFV